MSKDYYKILGVEKNASADEIKKAFKKLAMTHHPDRPGGSEAKFKEINEAYQVVGDVEKRKKYDQFGSDFEQQGGFGGASWEDFMRAARGQGGGFASGAQFDFGGGDFGDIFGDLFGFGNAGGGRRGSRQARGRDIQVDVEIDFNEAAFGVEKELNLRRQSACDVCHGHGGEPGSKMETCTTCKGQGQVMQVQRTILGNMQTVVACSVCEGRGQKPEKKCKHCGGSGVHTKSSTVNIKIPAGIDNGQAIKLTGHGEAAPHNGGVGDLYVQVHIKPNKFFTRERYDVHSNAEISFVEAVLGAQIKIQTIDGSAELKIPEGTEAGAVIRLKNKGIPELGRSNRGDQYVHIKLRVPKKLSKQARQALEGIRGEL